MFNLILKFKPDFKSIFSNAEQFLRFVSKAAPPSELIFKTFKFLQYDNPS